MKAFVTGCAGFIGSHLVDTLLEKDFEVIGIDCFTDYYSKKIKETNISDAKNHKNFKFINDDILNIKQFPEVDYVFHLAAQAGVRASWGKSFEIYTKNNVEATQQLLEFYKKSKIKKFVYSSSSSVYGDAKLPMKEDSLLKPFSPYGVTKLAGENLSYLYYRNYNVPTISLRYFTVYGPRQRPDMAIHKFFKAMSEGKEITIFGDGTQTRDFTYVSDAVSANLLAAESKIKGEVFNVGGGSRISVNELVKIMEKNSGKKANIKNIETQKGDVKDTLADVSKGKKLLGWNPKIDIHKGVEKQYNWMQQFL